MLSEYSYENIGQFRAIAGSLGYNIEYNKGELLFQKNDDSLKITMDGLRTHIKEDISEIQEKSRGEVSVFFDRDKANDNDYVKELNDKGITIVRWENLKVKDGKVADGFTVIDHNNKVAYTGKSLYEYAQQNNFILDGKGTQLEKGVMSDLLEHNGKPAKLRLNENGIAVFYKKEVLEIPDTLLNKPLNKKQKDLLLKGEAVVFQNNGRDLLIQVDKDLNQVIIKTNKEINIPDVIGKGDDFSGYRLTMGDKYLLANGHSIDNKLLSSEKGYFIADVSLTADKKGIAYSNIQSISNEKAEQLIAERNAGRDFEAELKQAVNNYDFNKLNDLKIDGYKPTLQVIEGLKEETNLTDKQENAIRKIFGFEPESKEIKEQSLEYLLSPSNVDYIKFLVDTIEETEDILTRMGYSNPETFEKYKYYESLLNENEKELLAYCSSIGIKEDLDRQNYYQIKNLIDQKADEYFSLQQDKGKGFATDTKENIQAQINEGIKIQITPRIHDTYDLLPKEIEILQNGKAIFVMGKDPVSGKEYEASLKMNPKTGIVEETKNIQVTPGMREEWYKNHFEYADNKQQNIKKEEQSPENKKDDQQLTDSKVKENINSQKNEEVKIQIDPLISQKYKLMDNEIEHLQSGKELSVTGFDSNTGRHIEADLKMNSKTGIVEEFNIVKIDDWKINAWNDKHQDWGYHVEAEMKKQAQEAKKMEFKEAVKNEDFQKINELKSEGYKPTKKILNEVYKDVNISENTKIAVETIIGVKASKRQTLGDVKLATSDTKPEKNIGREATNTVNKAFSDL